MGKPTGFLEYVRENQKKQPVEERVQHFSEFEAPLTARRLTTQAARCMDCGVPFCNSGCPVQNLIPEFNEYVYQGQWHAAYGTLQSTNNFPEFTGRVCPAPCESACCAGLVDEPVAIKQVELAIIEKAFAEGWVKPNKRVPSTGVRIAVVGSGPAGLAAADQLNLAGYEVTVFEKNEVVGGLLALGIPDFKLEKRIIKRRVDILKEQGVDFRTNTHVGVNFDVARLQEDFDYICLTGGSERPRDLPGRDHNLKGIHFAMDFLTQQNRRVGGREVPGEDILATGKHVVVIGGGDTGSDCVGTSIRQDAASVTQIEILPEPPKERRENNPWPEYPQVYRTSSSQEEGCVRRFSVLTRELKGQGKIEALGCVEVEWTLDEAGQWKMAEKAGSEFELQADLVLLAMGFVHPEPEGMLKQLGVELDGRGNVKTKDFRTSIKNVYAAGDMATGQSLVVRAINSGRRMAQALDRDIKGFSHLS
ncbi:MAG: glutamate synthase subunit beta [bacterium]|nr:glutamate synthase subunit beta [bacterium]